MSLGGGVLSSGSLDYAFAKDSIPASPSRFEPNKHEIVVRCGDAHSILAEI